MVYRLRIGTIFEAVVDTEGREMRGFHRAGAATALRAGENLDSPETAMMVLQAVNIREGKALLVFVNLPLCRRGGEGRRKMKMKTIDTSLPHIHRIVCGQGRKGPADKGG